MQCCVCVVMCMRSVSPKHTVFPDGSNTFLPAVRRLVGMKTLKMD